MIARRKAPTKAEAAYQDRARELGCVVCIHRGCQQPNETHIHHRNFNDWHGAKQLGQHAVVAMCAWHHDGRLVEGYSTDAMREAYGPSFAHAGDFRVWTDDVLPEFAGRGTERWQCFQNVLLGEGNGEAA